MSELKDRQARMRGIVHRDLQFIDEYLLLGVMSDLFDSAQRDLNLSDSCRSDILDWMVTEIYFRALQGRGIRLIGHFRYDEALSVLDRCDPDVLLNAMKHIQDCVWRLGKTTAKLMICGTDVILATERNNATRL